MSFFSGKKFLLVGFIVVLLVAIPLTIYMVGQQQKTRSGAAPSTTLNITPAAKTVAVGEDFEFDVTMDPGSNQVSFVKFTITYDSTKLATTGAGLVPNTAAFPSVLQGPVYSPGEIAVTLSIGGNPQNIVQAMTKVATLNFKAIAPTENAATTVGFDADTQVLSIATTDQFNENVLATKTPAEVTITGSVPPPTETPTPTTEATATPTPTTGVTPVPTTTPVPTSAPNQAPVCASLTLDRNASGSAPFSISLTANGTDSNGTISQVNFSFGDGNTQEVPQSEGSSSVSVQTSHTYTTGGTFTATAVMIDNDGASSDTANCTATITVEGAAATATPTPTTAVAATATPTPTIAPTGPAEVFAIGALGFIVTVIGALLLIVL